MTTAPRLPSGGQHEISYADQVAVVVEVGGGLRSYAVDGQPVLDGYAEDAMADGARGQTLVPWPNRVQNGSWTWRSRQLQLALTEPEQHNAIHGLVRWAGWELEQRTQASVRLGCTSYPQPGYPWPFRVTTETTLDADGLRVRTTITNLGTEPAPVAAGHHPYLTAGTPTVDTALLHLPVETWLPTGEQQIPTGRVPVAGSPYDFRSPRAIGDTHIDYAFTDLARDGDGRFRLSLAAPAGRTVTFWLDEAYPYVEVFTGDALPDESRRRRSLGVEPMSAPPNALATGEDLVVLDPGEHWAGEWGIAVG